MARLHRLPPAVLAMFLASHTSAMATVYTIPITNLTAADTGDYLTGEFDFGVSFSHVDSLKFEFAMPNGYIGFAPTIDNNYSRALYVVIHGTNDSIDFGNIGLGFPLASSLFANFSQIDPAESAELNFNALTPPIAWPDDLKQAFRDFVNSGHGRVMFVDTEFRLSGLPLGYVASYAIPEGITQARIIITGTPVPEPGIVGLLLLAGATIAGYARNSATFAVTHSTNVRAGLPVISRTVDVTKAGWPIAAAQASSSIAGSP
jgi:hypothetical protein